MWKISVLVIPLLLSSCGKRDVNYDRITQLNGSARLSQFELLPIGERFRLYNKIHGKSGHPHDVELSVGFKDKPTETIKFIISDLKSSKFTDFLRYLPIIYDVGKRSGVDICRPEYIGQLKFILASYNLSAAQTKALEGLRFSRCQLP